MLARAAPLAATLLLAAVWLRAAPAAAQPPEPGPSVDASLQPAVATIGDRLTLTVAVRHAADATVLFPSGDDDFAPFTLVAAHPPQTRASGADAVTTAAFELAVFATGAFDLPALAVEVRRGASVATVAIPRKSVRIEPVAPPSATLEDLRPPADPVAFGHGQPGWWQPALAFLILSGLGLGVFLLMRRALAIRPPAFSPPPEPPERAALRRLDALRDSTDGDAPAVYGSLSAIVRQYLEQRFAVPATALTPAEMGRALAAAAADPWPARLAENLLRQCDAVRFARYRPAPARVERDLASAYELVALTASRDGGGTP
ncbi:MAG TPA: DUF4381 family protein [Dehalococcoidia bacterium]|nr:DUF4381 family protein [Dehalococcoidia bacterium]